MGARTVMIIALFAFATPAGAQESGMAAIVGRYEYRDSGLVGSIELRDDHSFDYKVDGIGRPVEGEGTFHLYAQGIWQYDQRGRIALTNAPTTPPVFRQTSAVRDPSVRAAITIVTTDGSSAEDLGLRTNDGENGQLNMLSDNGWTIPLVHAWNTDDGDKGTPTRLPRNWEIVRSSDDLTLVKVALSPTGPNHFTFEYTRSPIEPFHLAARPVEGEPGAIEIEFGSASITMHKPAGK